MNPALKLLVILSDIKKMPTPPVEDILLNNDGSSLLNNDGDVLLNN